ncbi:hypothetical protein SAMN04487981_10735 [Streptomyces sp. cf386]|uniref:hypothetical protein n=1 Tax=Streptomyces sp. cf386 TaxID=1761904 RepID=UPI00088C1130|nr:hypothetical protein [Streptomyces sp. cf386]SDN84576.1 hypothetical protein SAMN04487981_10735 [Streptomyces sp. cf386]
MAEHDSDRERREDRDDREPEEQHVPFDEDAAWAAIVSGYGQEPPDPPGAKPFKSVEDLALLESDANDDSDDRADDRSKGTKDGADEQGDKGGESREDAPPRPLGSSVSFAPGVGGGPRDYSAPEPTDDDFDTDDEGHFVPPEPPPLPAADATAKFAWLAVIGGPILLLLAVLFGWEMTWWLATLGIGGFLGGFATLVMRMKTDDDDDDDPGRGAVV